MIYVGGDAHIGASYTIDGNGNKVITETGSSNTLYGVEAGSVCGGANGNSSYAGQTDGSYIIIDRDAVVHNNVFGGGNYGIIGSSGSTSTAEILEFTNATSSFQANEEYLITTSSTGGNGLSLSGTSLANESLSTSAEPSDSAKWIFESTGTQYYIKNASTGQYIYVSNVRSNRGTYTGTVTMSTTNKTAFNVSGTSRLTITYSYTSSSQGGGPGGGNQTRTLYLKYNNGWTIASGTTGTYNLYLLTYELLPDEDEPEDTETLVNIMVNGGTVENCIYGGANRNSIYGTVEIEMISGKVNGTIYGGSNIKGTIEGATLINISGGQLGTTNSEDTLFGGGLGSSTNVKGRVLLNINEKSNNTIIYGNVYGGSSQGKISNKIEINIQDIPSTANTLSIDGSVFGGGKGTDTSPADVSKNITVNVDGSNLNNCNIFGGSNVAGTISGKITVNIGKTYKSTVKNVYGGGNQASIGTETRWSICVFTR